MTSQAIPARPRPTPKGTERRDRWWLEPLLTVLGLGSFIVYSLWASLVNANYYFRPYISPFYSPCISANCVHQQLPVIGSWWTLTPAILILWAPLGFRTTCYYYRKAYYRAFFWTPPACAVPDALTHYSGETRFPFILQNIHRYFFYTSIVVVGFLWADVVEAFMFPNGFGMGLGTLVLLVGTALLTLYTLSCHSCRHLCGGSLDRFSGAPARYRVWRFITRLNEHHMLLAWVSLFGVWAADLYVRLVSLGVLHDVRFF